jgi:hypothetical protein
MYMGRGLVLSSSIKESINSGIQEGLHRSEA